MTARALGSKSLTCIASAQGWTAACVILLDLCLSVGCRLNCVVQVLLDDQLVKTQAMRASPYIKPLEAAAIGWEQLLTGAQVRGLSA